MRVSKIVVAPFLAMTLIAGTAACGPAAPELRACSEYEDEVLDLDDSGECASEDDDSKKKSKKKKSIGTTLKNKAKTSVSNKVKSGGGYKAPARRK